MRGGDRIKPLLGGKLCEPAITQLTPRRLDTLLGGEGVVADVSMPGKEVQAVLSGQLGDKRLVCIRLLAAQAVIEVCHREHDAQFRAKFQQHAQERNRVCTAGNGGSHAVARADQTLVADVVENFLAHGVIVRQRTMTETVQNRLMSVKSLASAILALFLGLQPVVLDASDTETSSCRNDSRAIAACFQVHGRLSNWNGNPTRRIWIIGTKRMLGLREGTELPVALQKSLSDFDHEVYGDFEFCPFTPAKSGVMQVGCLAKVSNYQIKVRR